VATTKRHRGNRAGDPQGGEHFSQLLASREIAIFTGSGGVGKTTMAAAAALHAAVHLGGKVLVLTVDPARRLADAMGLSGLGNVETRMPDDAFEAAGLHPRGELWAAQLDTKRSWDDLVLRHAADQATAYRILDNKLYRNLTARFIQSHDYIAMERLYELHASGTYDLIVVDTPPSRNAIDFIEAPNRMEEFFGGRMIKIFTAPYRMGGGLGGRAFNLATRPFYRIADQILGGRFLEEVAEFFFHFQTMAEGFAERAESVKRLLRDRRTTVAVVTTLESAALNEAEFFLQKIQEFGLPLGALILNRVLPEFLLDDAAAKSVLRLGEPSLAKRLATEVGGLLADEPRVRGVLATLGENFMNYRTVAGREAAEMRRITQAAPGIMVTVPYFEVDIYDLNGLRRAAEALFAP
jgi:anion-transporting  ArsA/GET3 family ATPase